MAQKPSMLKTAPFGDIETGLRRLPLSKTSSNTSSKSSSPVPDDIRLQVKPTDQEFAEKVLSRHLTGKGRKRRNHGKKKTRKAKSKKRHH